MDFAGGIRDVDIPESVRGKTAAIQRAYAGAQHPALTERGLPRGHAGIGRVIEAVLGVSAGYGVLRANQPVIVQIERLRTGERDVQPALDAGESQPVDVQCPPGGAHVSAVVIDAVAHPAVEYGQLAAHPGARLPIDAGFVSPGALRPQTGISEVDRVG